MKRIKWRVNYNRPLSYEERQIAERLATDPQPARVVETPQSWHSPLTVSRQGAQIAPQPEEA